VFLAETLVDVCGVFDTVGKVSIDRQYKKFSSTDGGFFRTVRIKALKCVSTKNDPIATGNLY